MTGARIRADLSFRPLRDGLILSMAIGLIVMLVLGPVLLAVTRAIHALNVLPI